MSSLPAALLAICSDITSYAWCTRCQLLCNGSAVRDRDLRLLEKLVLNSVAIFTLDIDIDINSQQFHPRVYRIVRSINRHMLSCVQSVHPSQWPHVMDEARINGVTRRVGWLQ